MEKDHPPPPSKKKKANPYHHGRNFITRRDVLAGYHRPTRCLNILDFQPMRHNYGVCNSYSPQKKSIPIPNSWFEPKTLFAEILSICVSSPKKSKLS